MVFSINDGSRTYYSNAKRRKRLGQTVGHLQRSQGTGGKGTWERGSNISSTTIFTIVPFYFGTYNKKFVIQIGNEVWRNSCVERVLLCITIVTRLYLTRGCVGALFHKGALDMSWL